VRARVGLCADADIRRPHGRRITGNATKRGTPHDPSAVSRQGLDPDFTSRLMHDLSHAYTVVIVVAIILVALMFSPRRCCPGNRLLRSRARPRCRHGTSRAVSDASDWPIVETLGVQIPAKTDEAGTDPPDSAGLR
jgi:hypothetical protein